MGQHSIPQYICTCYTLGIWEYYTLCSMSLEWIFHCLISMNLSKKAFRIEIGVYSIMGITMKQPVIVWDYRWFCASWFGGGDSSYSVFSELTMYDVRWGVFSSQTITHIYFDHMAIVQNCCYSTPQNGPVNQNIGNPKWNTIALVIPNPPNTCLVGVWNP